MPGFLREYPQEADKTQCFLILAGQDCADLHFCDTPGPRDFFVLFWWLPTE